MIINPYHELKSFSIDNQTNKMQRVNIGLYIGRFAPFHNAHKMVILDALEKCDILIMCIGSHSTIRTKRTPWTTRERIEMIKVAFTKEQLQKIKFYPLIDYHDMKEWIADITKFIENFKTDQETIGLFGCLKDTSSSYLEEFPQQFYRMLINEPLINNLSSTSIRENYFHNKIIDQTVLPPGTYEYLLNYNQQFEYDKLV